MEADPEEAGPEEAEAQAEPEHLLEGSLTADLASYTAPEPEPEAKMLVLEPEVQHASSELRRKPPLPPEEQRVTSLKFGVRSLKFVQRTHDNREADLWGGWESSEAEEQRARAARLIVRGAQGDGPAPNAGRSSA